MPKTVEEKQEPTVKLRGLSGRGGRKPKPPVQENQSARPTPPPPAQEVSELPVTEPPVERPSAVKGKRKKGVPVRHICFDERRDKMLFQLQLDASQQVGKRVTVSELARIGIDCLGEMDMDELLQRLSEG